MADYREGWKSRGRELQALYDVLGPAMPLRNADPVEDLRLLVEQRDRFRHACEEAYECLTSADDLGPDTSETAVEAARMVLADPLGAVALASEGTEASHGD